MRRAKVTPASGIRMERQRWFWDQRIPAGTIAVFAGKGGEGKSTFAFHLVAEATRGRLAGDHYGKPIPVLIWSGEDRWESVTLPRLHAAEANLNHVFKLDIESTVDADTLEVTPNLPADLPHVQDAIEQTGAGLVILDPLSSTMGGDLNKESDVRRTLDGLARLAHTTDTVILAVRHFNKGAGNASDKMSGSHAFRDAARSVFLFAADEESGQRIVSQDKGNYSEHGSGSLAFALDSIEVPMDDGTIATAARVVILGDSDVSVSDIINRAPVGEDTDDRNAAQAFIVDYLRGIDVQEAAASDVLKAGRAAGFSDNEIKHARNRCKHPRIESRKAGFGRAGWVWAIVPEGATEDATSSRTGTNGTYGTYADPVAPMVRIDLPDPLEGATESVIGAEGAIGAEPSRARAGNPVYCMHGVTVGGRCSKCRGTAGGEA